MKLKYYTSREKNLVDCKDREPDRSNFKCGELHRWMERRNKVTKYPKNVLHWWEREISDWRAKISYKHTPTSSPAFELNGGDKNRNLQKNDAAPEGIEAVDGPKYLNVATKKVRRRRWWKTMTNGSSIYSFGKDSQRTADEVVWTLKSINYMVDGTVGMYRENLLGLLFSFNAGASCNIIFWKVLLFSSENK